MPYLYKRVKTKHKDFVTRTKCFYYNPTNSKKSRGIRLCSTGESKKSRNKHNSYLRKKYLIYNNFDVGDMWVTLTYSKDSVPNSPDEAHKLIMSVLGKVRKRLKRKNIPLIYFVKTEAGERSRVHHHLIIKNNFEVASVLYEYWKQYGRVRDFQEIYDLSSGRLVNYFLDSKEHKDLNFEKYSHSRNMAEPEIETRVYPYASFRTNPRPPKPKDGYTYKIANLFNSFPDGDGFIYQEYEIIKNREEKKE